MQIFQEKFPGLDRVEKFLPHTGKLFLKALAQFEQVDLEPEVPHRNLPRYGSVKLAVLRHGGTYEIFPAYGYQLFLNLENIKPPMPKFRIQEEHRGKDIYAVVEKYGSFLRIRLGERLAKYEFFLELSAECRKELDSLDLHQQYFGPSGKAPSFKENPAKLLQFKVTSRKCDIVSRRRKEFPGLEFPKRFLTCYWDRVMPVGRPHYYAIQLCALWNHEWEVIARCKQPWSEFSTYCKSKWKQYQGEMRQFEEIFNA